MKHLFRLLAMVATLAMVASACSGSDGGDRDGNADGAADPDDQTAADRVFDDTLTVYGRAEGSELFEHETGVKVLARGGSLGDLTDQIIKEGANSPADVFYAPLSDALGLLSAAAQATSPPADPLPGVRCFLTFPWRDARRRGHRCRRRDRSVAA
jgi:ABC-type glycerol-3-phosphate transport system substrate-binding protein